MGMLDKINMFVDTMIEEKSVFEQLENEIQRCEDDIDNTIKKLDITEQQIKEQLEDEIIKSGNADMKEMFTETAQAFTDTIKNADNRIGELKHGMKFIEDFEKQFIVSVFGKVKSGKSYLGNFILGLPVRKNGIASSYDKIKEIPVNVYDKGVLSSHDGVDITKTSAGDEGFRVDKKEATSTIQWVNIGGLCWFDTPGIGSLTIENEELAEKYVKNSDLVIYTCISDAPGTRQDFEEIKQLHSMGKPILLVLTQSDTTEEEYDEETDDFYQVRVPKSDKDRKDQENYMIETLRENGLEDALVNAEILTVSAFLAEEAIANEDEALFESSNMDKLLDKLVDITKNQAAQMKKQTPKMRINAMIDSVIEDLKGICEEIYRNNEQLEENKIELSQKKDWILESIRTQVQSAVLKILSEARAEVDNTKETISGTELKQRIEPVVYDSIYKVCKEEMIQNMKNMPKLSISLGSISDLKMRTERIPFEVIEVNSVERDPVGLFEKIGHKVLHKTYYTSETSTRTDYHTIENGVNSVDVSKDLMLQLESVFAESVDGFISNILLCFYEPMEKMNTLSIDNINNTIDELFNLKME